MKSEFLSFVQRWTGELLIVSIIIGFFIPGLALFSPIVSWLLMFLLFSSFLNLDLSIHKFFRKELLAFPIINWVLLPVIIYFLSRSMNLDYRLGLFLIIITPPALGSPVIIALAKGDMEFAVSNVVIYNIFSPIVYAFLPPLFFREISQISSPWSVFQSVAFYIFIPLIIALVVRKFKRMKGFINYNIDPFKGLVQLFMIAVVVSSSAPKIKALPLQESLFIFGLTLGISFTTYFSAYFLCRKDLQMRHTLPVAAGHKNTLLSIVTGLNNFNPTVAVPSILYLVSHHIWNGIVIYLSGKNGEENR